MPTQGLITEAVNFEELKQAMADAPDLTFKFVKGELLRFSRRVRRLTIRHMAGAKAKGPGAKSASEPLYGGQFKSGKHVQGFTVGNSFSTLKAVSKISRILRVHEEGATISPKAGGVLFLSRKTGKAGKGHIFARVQSVTIPKRLQFQRTWNEQVPDGQRRIHDAMRRAMQVALERRMKAIGLAVQRVVNA